MKPSDGRAGHRIAGCEFGDEKVLEGCIDGNCVSEQVPHRPDVCVVHDSPR